MGRGSYQLYEEWNDAIAEVVYPLIDSPAPVYLDLEDEPLLAIAERLGLTPDRPSVEASLSDAVRWVLGLEDSDGALSLGRVTAKLERWARREDGSPDGSPPPILPVLGILSLAADRMSSSDTMSDANFYGRLNQLLGLKHDDQRIQSAYRRQAERLWRTLNVWLDSQGGMRGTPTAFALGKRYVGLPLSQALIRQTDRDRLPAFFAEYGLAPGATLAPDAVEPLFEQWLALRSGIVSNHVRRAWSGSRSAVAEAVAASLATWDGTLPGEHTIERRSVLQIHLALDVRSFPSKRMHLEPQIPLVGASEATYAIVDTTDGKVRVDLLPAAPGWAVLAYGSEVANEGLLSGPLSLELGEAKVPIAHKPRRLMAFHQDAATSRWITADRVHLGQDLRFLVREELAESVTGAFEECARPGWTSVEQMSELPTGWRLYLGVQLFRSPTFEGFNDLSLLAPYEKFHAELAGGFQLPGTTRRTWHVGDPPEVRVTSEKRVTVRVVRESADLSGATPDVEVWLDETTDGMLVQPLLELDLPPGTYRFEVRSSSTTARSSNRFQLVSGDQQDEMRWSYGEAVEYNLRTPLGAIGVLDPEASGPKVQGMIVTGEPVEPAIAQLPDSLSVPERRAWEGPRAIARSKERLRLIGVSSDSCLYSGKHHEVLDTVPTNKWGKALVKYSYGRCKGCGLERRYLTRPKDKTWPSPATTATPEHVGAPDLPSTHEAPDRAEGWDRMLDALYFLGRGSVRDFAKVAANVEPGPLFAHEAMRTLESLGHIDVARDADTLEVVRWEVSPSAVHRTGDDWRLVGYWPDQLTDDMLNEHALDLFESPSRPGGPTSWYVSDASDSDLELTTAEGLLEVLPRLSEVLMALPRRSMIATEAASWCDPADGRWKPATSIAGVGSFRVDSYASRYLVRTPSDQDQQTLAPATVYLAKHIAPLVLGRPPLLAYSRATETLAVPKGADLPGLYERAVVATTGLLPRIHGASLIYDGVSHDLARYLTWLLTDLEGITL